MKTLKQIKTVTYPIYESVLFDEKVNSLLNKGWKMNKREIISVKGEVNEVGSSAIVQTLYAEFEK